MTPTKVALILLFILKPSLIAQEYIEQATPPWGYVFKGWKGPPIDVINYFPASATKSSPILIVIPGASRDEQRFHASWLDLAKKKSFIVLTIGARKKYFPDEYSYNAGRLITSQGHAMDKSQWLFSAIKPLFEDFKKRLDKININLEIIETSSYKSFFEKLFQKKKICIYWNKTYEPDYLKFDKYLSTNLKINKIHFINITFPFLNNHK